MAVTPTATDAKRLIPILDPDWKTLDKDQLKHLNDTCLALMKEAVLVLEEKAKFTVVGQIYWTKEDGTFASADPKAEKVCVGMFATEAQANAAADSLHGSQTASERLAVWPLPVWHGTPGAWRKARREVAGGAALKAAGPTTQAALAAQLVTAAYEASKVACPKVAPSEEGDFVPCIRALGHPGRCWDEVPSMNGV